MAKLDPDSWKSAKDVMDERAVSSKRKRDTDGDADEDAGSDSALLQDTELELPKAVQDAQGPKPKKQKTEVRTVTQSDGISGTEETEEDRKRRKMMQKAAKRERRQEKKNKAKDKLDRQKAKKIPVDQPVHAGSPGPNDVHLKEPINLELPSSVPLPDVVNDHESSASSDEEQPEVFSPQHESGISSTSSIQPTTFHEVSPPLKPDQANLTSSTDQSTSQTARERLQAAISHLRAERKADGPDGHAPKNRRELLEQRRRKEEEKKAAKKEQRRRDKEEEARRQDEEIERRFSPGGSGSLLASPRSPMIGDNTSSNSFSFGRIAFEDGTQFDPAVSGAVEGHKKKGPKDKAAELQVALAKKNRLAGLDEDKRREIEEKDMWLNAKRRAHGDHVRDDTSLLKKALKRQQGQKKKSEREWSDRIQGVQKSQEVKQKKRTENLNKRKEEKRGGGGGGGKKVKRPGFEGSFKGRTGGKRKS